MHIRGGHGHVAQARCAKAAAVAVFASEFHDAGVVGGVTAPSVDVVQTRVVKARFSKRQAQVLHVVVEGETTVAVVTLHFFAKEQRFTPLGGGADGLGLLAVLVAVVGAVKRQQAALKRRQSLGQRAERIQRRIALPRLGGEGLREQACVDRVGLDALEQLGFAPGQPHLHRVLAEQGDERLHLQAREQRVGPSQGGPIRHIGQSHAAAWAHLTGDARRQRQAIGEGLVLVVARRTRHLAVGREAWVVKQVPTQIDLGSAHGVVGGHARRRHPLGQAPVETAERAAPQQEPGGHGHPHPFHRCAQR